MSQPLAARQLSGADVAPLPPGLYPARSPLEGRYARLEPLNPLTHAEELWEACRKGVDTDRTWDYMGYGPFTSLDAFRGWLRDNAAQADPVFYVIRDGRDGKAAGMASFLRIEPKNGVIEIGHIWLAQSLRNSREATEGLYLLMRNAFDDLGYRRLEWKCDALNAASRSAAARLGFAFEGIFYQHMIYKGHNRDTAWFSILDSEWPAIRANFETWLSPDNFDDSGNQRQSLGALNRALRAE
jgi:RimJ/RimL family protein N-acetyltransferase